MGSGDWIPSKVEVSRMDHIDGLHSFDDEYQITPFERLEQCRYQTNS